MLVDNNIEIIESNANIDEKSKFYKLLFSSFINYKIDIITHLNEKSEKLTKRVHKIVKPILKNELDNFIEIETKILSNYTTGPTVKNSKISKEEFILFDLYNENIDKDDFTDSHTFENSFSSNVKHFRQNNLLALESVAIANRKYHSILNCKFYTVLIYKYK